MKVSTNGRFSRRRAVIVLAVLLCVGALVYLKLTREHDPRLVGQWSANPAPTHVIAVFAAWEFLSDGTGRRRGKLRPHDDSGPVSGAAAESNGDSGNTTSKSRVLVVHMQGKFRWWTEGDRLHVRPVANMTAWRRAKETAFELYREIRGLPAQYPTWDYVYVVEEDGTIRITPDSIPSMADRKAFHLTRLDEGRTP